MQLYVLDRSKNVLATTSSQYNDKHHKELTAGVSSFEFDINKNDEATQYMVSGNYITTLDDQGRPWSFTILYYDEYQLYKTIYCEDVGIELYNKACDVWHYTESHPFEYYLDLLTDGTPWELGVNQLSNLSRTLNYTGRDTGLGRLLSVLKEFDDAECIFNIQMKGPVPVKYVIDVYKKIGTVQDNIQIAYNEELDNIQKTETRQEFATALSGVGSVIQDTETNADGTAVDTNKPQEYVNFADLEYDNGGFYTTKGDKFIRARTANAQFNPGDQGYIEDFYEYDTKSSAELFNRTLTQIQTRSQPQFTYEADVKVIDPSLDIGDTVTIIDHDYNPALYLQARVATLDKSYTDTTKGSITFTNYVVLTDTVTQQIAALKSKVNGIKNGSSSYVWIRYADDDKGTNISQSPKDKTYVAILAKVNQPVPSDNPNDYAGHWVRIAGEDGLNGQIGPQGHDGADGIPGKDGKTSYTHIAYADTATGGGFSQSSDNKKYIGIYADFEATDSTDVTKYNWSLIKGADGANGKDGVPGKAGSDGKTPYFHIAYADSADGNTNFSLDTPGYRKYIGSYTDFTQADSDNKALYSWQLVQGPKGDIGADGLAGKDGIGIKSTAITYALGDSGTVRPTTGWTTSVPSLVKGQYLWTKTVWTYTDNSFETGYSVTYISKDGNNGSNGLAGKDGVGIKTTTITYAGSTSGTTAPTSGWTSTVPTVAAGSYLWTKTVWAYTDNTSETGYSVAMMGVKGDTGSILGENQWIGYKYSYPGTTRIYPNFDHIKGLNPIVAQIFDDSTTFSFRDDYYIAHFQSNLYVNIDKQITTTVSHDDGLTIYCNDEVVVSENTTIYAPYNITFNLKAGWNRIDVLLHEIVGGEQVAFGTKLSNLVEHLSYIKGPQGDTGADGVAGKDGVGIKSTAIAYQLSSSGTTAPIGTWSATVPTLTKGQYLWTRTTLTYTDNSGELVYSVSYVAKDGNNGTDGVAGKDGVGIKSTTITYQSGTSGTVQPTGSWVASPPSVAGGNYLWTRTVWSYTDGTSETGYSVARAGEKGDKGDTGADGLVGKDGVGIKSTVVAYQLGTSGTTQPTNNWSSTVPTLVKGQYLWTKTTWNYSDNTTEDGFSVAYIAKDGSSGADGLPGKDGTGIKSTVIEYAVSSNGITKPSTGWSATVPSVTAGQFMWTRTTWLYTDGTNEVGYSVAQAGETGAKGDTGLPGKDGVAGKDGIGIKTTVITYAQSASGTTAPTTGWTSSVPSLVKGQYFWTKTTWNYSDNTSESGYSTTYISKDGNNGSNGLAGKDGVGIKTTTITYAGSTSGTTAPTSGWTSTVPTVAAGSYLWTKTVWAYTDNTSEIGYSVAMMGVKGDTGSILGENQWIGYKYSYPGTTRIYPNFDHIKGLNPIVAQIFDDSTTFSFRDDYYIAHFQSNLYVNIDKQITTTVSHDDDLTIYCNDEVVVSENTTIYAPYNITFNLKAGWNRIDVLLHEIVGGEQVAFGTKLSNLVEHLSYIKGPQGDQGIKGPSGTDGKTSYTHIAYANSATGEGFNELPAGKTFIGMYVDFEVKDSTDATKYKWSLVKGSDGANGTPGKAGADGKTPYLHVAYSNSADGATDFTTDNPDGKKFAYLGTYTDYTPADPTDHTKYLWSLVKGEAGANGKDGQDAYLHIAYANSVDGKTGFTTDKIQAHNRDYLGTYSDNTKAQSTDPTKYTWQLTRGVQGLQGQPGSKDVPVVTMSSTAPSNPKNGDFWYQTTTDASGQKITGFSVYSGGKWVPSKIDQSTLVLTKLVSVEIDSATINSPDITVPFDFFDKVQTEVKGSMEFKDGMLNHISTVNGGGMLKTVISPTGYELDAYKSQSDYTKNNPYASTQLYTDNVILANTEAKKAITFSSSGISATLNNETDQSANINIGWEDVRKYLPEKGQYGTSVALNWFDVMSSVQSHPNLLYNSSLISGTTNWGIGGNAYGTNVTHDGNFAVCLESRGGGNYFFQDLNHIPDAGNKICISFWANIVKHDGGVNGGWLINLNGANQSYVTILGESNPTFKAGWRYYQFDPITVPSGTTGIRFNFYNNDHPGNKIYFAQPMINIGDHSWPYMPTY